MERYTEQSLGGEGPKYRSFHPRGVGMCHSPGIGMCLQPGSCLNFLLLVFCGDSHTGMISYYSHFQLFSPL